MLSQRQPRDPEAVGNFHILGRLGHGGFGTVFAAHDHNLPDELVAVKVLKPPSEDTHDFAVRFTREIEGIKRVESSYVPAFIGGGISGSPWLAIDLVPGLSLYELVKDHEPLAEGTVWHIGQGIVAALQAIADANLVHRDLKPGNVLLTHDGPKIIDFGLVHLAELPHSQWSHEMRAGTIEYTPPEVLRSGLREGNTAGDIFMLGGTLVYAATGHPPFQSAPERLRAQPVAMPPYLAGLPDGLVPIVRRCLVEDPASRPTLGALAAEFSKRAQHDQVLADLLPHTALRLLAIFRQELDEALSACARASARSERATSSWDWRNHQSDSSAVKNIRPEPRTKAYTRDVLQVTDDERATAAERPPVPSRRVIRPMRLDHPDSWDVRDDSWQSVRWACQFGAWIQAPVTVVGRVAVAVDLDGTIGGLDAFDGSQLWAFGLKAAVRSAAIPLPGPAAEVCMGDASGVVHAVELRSGKRRTLLRAGGAIHGPIATDGSKIYAVSADGGLYIIDAEMQANRVLFSTRDLAPCGPAAQAGLIFVVTTQGEVLALDSVSGSLRWKMSTSGRIGATPLPVRDRLYIAGSDGQLLEVDSSGQVRATAHLGAPVHTRLAHDGYRLYAGTGDGTVRAFRLDRQRGPELTPVWQTPLGGEITGLAAIGGQVYAAAGTSVLKLDPESGARTLVVRMECPVAAAPAVEAGLLYVAGLGGTVCCVSPN